MSTDTEHTDSSYAEILEISGVAAQGNPHTPIWDSMNEFELMRGSLEETINGVVSALRSGADEDRNADAIIDVAVVLIRLSEIVERHQREVDTTLETASQILQVQADTNALVTQAMADVRDTLYNLDSRLTLVEDGDVEWEDYDGGDDDE